MRPSAEGAPRTLSCGTTSGSQLAPPLLVPTATRAISNPEVMSRAITIEKALDEMADS